MSKQLVGISLIVFIVLLGGFLRLYLLNEIPIGLYSDEAMNGNNALEAIHNTNFSVEGEPAFSWKIFYPENNGREGFFINLQALSLWFFGNTPWALRLVSALLGVLTVLGIYLLAKELFVKKSEVQNPRLSPASDEQAKSETNPNTQNVNTKNRRLLASIFEFQISRNQAIALLSAFFMATSYWHVNFSRIGFRAIAVPLLSTFGIYFLLRGLRQGHILDMVLAGIFVGLGFHTYIAFRLMPLVLIVPLGWYMWQWWINKRQEEKGNYNPLFAGLESKKCVPCLALLFIFITFVVALPMGYYFLQHPEDLLGRTSQVSIFSAESPLLEFAKSNVLTLGMFFVRGDCNWRHNFDCQPELHPIVGVFFAVGIIISLLAVFRSLVSENKLSSILLLLWLIFMSFPATLTREGLPHALRAIGMIPPVMILAGIGGMAVLNAALRWLGNLSRTPSAGQEQLQRLRYEIIALFVILMLLIPLATFKNYFVRWAKSSSAYFAFSTDLLHLGNHLNNLPKDTKKYIIANLPGVDVRGVPMSAQTVMFITDSFREEGRRAANIEYLLPNQLDRIKLEEGKHTVITLLRGQDREIIRSLREKFPQMTRKVPGDFIILEIN